MSNYPAGVSDNHEYFNPPREVASAVECGADEALVVPFAAVNAAVAEARKLVERGDHAGAAQQLALLELKLDDWKQEREYECPFNDELDLEESECARWDCPVCGNERETDTLPEERDPDEEWERRNER